jgi:hypothetical protein
MRLVKMPVNYYQQFDADYHLDVPAEGFGGWKKGVVEMDLDRTAVVVMHAWDYGTPEQFPGWHRVEEHIPRIDRIVREVFLPLLAGVRKHHVKLWHVVGGGSYYKDYPGYRRAVQLAAAEPPVQRIPSDPARDKLVTFRNQHVFVGAHNMDDVIRGFKAMDFPPEARPQGDEGVAENAAQLGALCLDEGVNHLIYAGFAINWCLLMSPGGMLDMSRHGVMCSAFRQAVTAVENKETARRELNKEEGLWRVAIEFGFVLDVADWLKALDEPAGSPPKITEKL